jgi:hypothetical protein
MSTTIKICKQAIVEDFLHKRNVQDTNTDQFIKISSKCSNQKHCQRGLSCFPKTTTDSWAKTSADCVQTRWINLPLNTYIFQWKHHQNHLNLQHLHGCYKLYSSTLYPHIPPVNFKCSSCERACMHVHTNKHTHTHTHITSNCCGKFCSCSSYLKLCKAYMCLICNLSIKTVKECLHWYGQLHHFFGLKLLY